MSDYDRSIRTLFATDFANVKLHNDEKLLLVVAACARGIIGEKVPTATVKKRWPKVLFSIVYHPSYFNGAEAAGWVDRNARGYASLTEEGLNHLDALSNDKAVEPLSITTELLVFSAKQTHDFDITLRGIMASATKCVRIADSYIDETIFDTLLNVIPSGVRIELMYNHDTGTSLKQRISRFRVQYPDFHYARYPKLHDRYLIIDDIGFVVGPSLKDAALNAPAILVRIGSEQSPKLVSLFDNTFKNLTKIT